MNKGISLWRRAAAGLVVFLCIAVLTTGIALLVAFGAGHGGSDSLILTEAHGAVSFGQIRLNGELPADGSAGGADFVFDSLEGDNSGRVRWDGVNGERLSVTVSGVLYGADRLAELSFTLELSENILAAAERGYVDISDYYSGNVQNRIVLPWSADGLYFDENGNCCLNFEFVVSLGWGDKFSNLNPSVYYDTIGADVPMSQVLEVLSDLRGVLDGSQGYVVHLRATAR